MNWIAALNNALDYIEENLTSDLCFDEIANVLRP